MDGPARAADPSILIYGIDIWLADYACKPSFFNSSKSSDFCIENRKICELEWLFIERKQETEGSGAMIWAGLIIQRHGVSVKMGGNPFES
ncbi:hypothetical protein [Holdemania massiliensis]